MTEEQQTFLELAVIEQLTYDQITEETGILPIFNRTEDDKVVRQFEELFNRTTIVPIVSNELSREGGIINCVTWNIKKKE